MSVIYAPNSIPVKDPRSIVFLAGSIEMGIAEPWQEAITPKLVEHNIVVLNPRRPDWNNAWGTTKNDGEFKRQVEWELYGLEYADAIIMYFDPNTKSPISLLELGLHAKSSKIYVCCPDGFWKKGNVDIVCDYYDISQFDTLDELVNQIITNYGT